MKAIERVGIPFTYLYVITECSEITRTGGGFRISFRTYESNGDFGGFETTLIVHNCSIEKAEEFVGSVTDRMRAANKNKAIIFSKTTDNRNAAKFSFPKVQKMITDKTIVFMK